MPRIDSLEFIEKNIELSKHPRAYLVMSFDLDNTDTVIIVSHNDVVPSGIISTARLMQYPSTSQSLKPLQYNNSIGSLSPVIQDIGSALTTLISSKLAAGFGLRGKRVQIYLGYKGLEPTKYALFQTQIVDRYSYIDGRYNFSCKDAFVFTQVKLFPEIKTTLGADFLVGDTATITLADTSKYSTLYHGAGWDHLPLPGGDNRVGYFKIDDEVCSFRTITNGTTLTTIERGLFGTQIVDHLFRPTQTSDKQIKVTEFMFFDMPAVKLLYAILTGVMYNDGELFPWGLDVSTDYVETVKFTNIGAHIWDTTTDLSSNQIPATFRGLKEVNAKEFIEKKILPLIGCNTPILNNGKIGLRTLTRIIKDANAVRTLDSGNIISYGQFRHDLTQVSNNYVINWNKNVRTGDTTRTNTLFDTVSQARHGKSKKITLTLDGLDGARHTDAFIVQMMNMMRDRYAGPPILLDVNVFYTENDLNVGEIIRLNAPFIRDATTGNPANLSMEIQRLQIDPQKGSVKLSLFGSTETATPISPTSGTALVNGWYEKDLLAANKLDAALSTTFTGGVLHLDTNGTLIGQAILPGASNNAVYWYDGPIQIDPNVVITVTQNVMIIAAGFIQIDGKIDGKGQGIAGSLNGTNGYIGNTVGQQGSSWLANCGVTSINKDTASSGDVSIMPVLNLTYNGSSDFLGLSGYQLDLRGASGANGGETKGYDSEGNALTLDSGGLGTAGGAGLTIVHRGIACGSEGEIDLSGADILPVSNIKVYDNPNFSCFGIINDIYIATSEGGNGAAGGLNILGDGSAVSVTDVVSNFTAFIGQPRDIVGEDYTQFYYAGYSAFKNMPAGVYRYGFFQKENGGRVTPFRRRAVNISHSNIQYIPASQLAVPDLPDYADTPLSLTLVEIKNSPRSFNGDLASIQVTVGEPSSINYSHSNVYIKVSTKTDWDFAGVADPVFIIKPLSMIGTSYDVQIRAVSALTGLESPSGPVETIILSDVYESITDLNTIIVPNVRGLQLKDNITEIFTGKHAYFVWRDSSDTDWLEIGAEPFAQGIGGSRDQYFSHYQILIYDASNNLIFEDATENNYYDFTYEKNANLSGGPYRTFRFTVTRWSNLNTKSDTPASVLAANPAPLVPTGITLTPGYGSFLLSWIIPTDLDYEYCNIYISSSSGFMQDDTTYLDRLVKADSYSIHRDAVGNLLGNGATYYVTMQPVDAFGTTGLTTVELSATTLQIVASDIDDGIVTEIKIANDAVTNAKVANDAINTAELVDLAISNAKLALLSVDTPQLNIDSVTNDKVAPGAVNTLELVDLAISNAKIALLAVNTPQIANDAVDTTQIANLAVSTGKIDLLAVDTAQINNAAIINSKIDNLAVGSAQIQAASITTAKIANLAVQTAQLDTASVTNAKIDNLAVSTAQIQLAAITTALIDNLAVTTALIDNAAVTNAKINSLDVAKLTSGIISAAIIELQSGGVIHSEFMTAFNAGKGFWLDDVGGAGRAAFADYVNEKGMVFDGDDLKVLKNTKLLGAEAYANDNISVSGHLFNLFPALTISTSGGGTVTSSADGVNLNVTTSGTVNLSYAPTKTLQEYTWGKDRRFKVLFTTSSTSTTQSISYIGNGYVKLSGGRGVSFKFHSDGKIYGGTGNNSSTTLLELMTYTTSTEYFLEIIYKSATSVEFKVDGISKGTIITTIPTGTVDSHRQIAASMNYVSGSSNSINIGEFKFDQAE